MEILSVFDDAFRLYGQIHDGLPTQELMEALKKTPVTDGVVYTAKDPALQELAFAALVRDNLYGGMPAQLGWCNGHNTKMNCLEYHRDSEFNFGTSDFILLVANQGDIVNGKLDASCVKAFRVPAGVMAEVYATTLHYAPCQTGDQGFQVLVALPDGTNTDKPEMTVYGGDDALLRARNKWLIAHPDAPEAQDGAYVGITGINPDIKEDI